MDPLQARLNLSFGLVFLIFVNVHFFFNPIFDFHGYDYAYDWKRIRLWIYFLISKFNHKLIGWFSNLICDQQQFRDWFDWTISNAFDWTFTLWTSFVIIVIIQFALIWWIRLMLLNLIHILFLLCFVSTSLFLYFCIPLHLTINYSLKFLLLFISELK